MTDLGVNLGAHLGVCSIFFKISSESPILGNLLSLLLST